jgi:hypothetical protein
MRRAVLVFAVIVVCQAVTLVGAGLGGVFGFLVGLASPRYRWVAVEAE